MYARNRSPPRSLQIITLEIRLDRAYLFFRQGEPFVTGNERLFLGRAHVSENHARNFFARVRHVAKFLFEVAVRRLSRSVQHIAVYVILPAVIHTAQAALFVATEE